jgi:hypothetical protein
MINTFAYILLALVLILIAYQDFKTLRVSIILYGLSIILAAFIGLDHIEKFTYLKFITINLSILVIQTAILIFYLYVRTQGNLSFFSSIGKGDMVFFVTIALFFPPISFIIFQICSFLLILFFHSTLRKLKWIGEFVPLAGYQAIILFTLIIVSFILKSYSSFNYLSIIKLIY